MSQIIADSFQRGSTPNRVLYFSPRVYLYSKRRVEQLSTRNPEAEATADGDTFQQAEALACVLERRLFETAPSMNAYLDPNTMEKRVKLLCMVLASKIEKQRSLRSQHTISAKQA
jgi:hypothetical protein